MAGIEDRVNNWLKNPWTLAHRPFKVVDNVYFVGTSWVSAFLLNTQKGLVLIDCAMQETLYLLVDSIRELGFNPRQIKKLLLTHGHFDHCGAARAIKEMSGCEIWLGKDDEYFFTERRELHLKIMSLDSPLIGFSIIRVPLIWEISFFARSIVPGIHLERLQFSLMWIIGAKN